jgi:hypothetical protein
MISHAVVFRVLLCIFSLSLSTYGGFVIYDVALPQIKPLLTVRDFNEQLWTDNTTVLSRNGLHASYHNYTIAIATEARTPRQRWVKKSTQHMPRLERRGFGPDILNEVPQFSWAFQGMAKDTTVSITLW